MSELNLLNASASDPLNPNFNWDGEYADNVSRFAPPAGKISQRVTGVAGIRVGLQWLSRPLATMAKLKQWYEQYKLGFFTVADYETGRYYTGHFVSAFKFTPVGYERWNIELTFEEIPGVAMYAYPTNWARDAVFLEERDDWGSDLVKLTGGPWTYATDATRHGGHLYQANALDSTAEWHYIGYGFRLWSIKGNFLGIVEISLDNVVLGTVDLYNAAQLNSAVVFTKADVPLDKHRVKIRCTHTKNAASGDYYIEADAIEVMH